MSLRITRRPTKAALKKKLSKTEEKFRSRIASAMNKETRDVRREVVENIMLQTGLKRKVLNDRMALTRANPYKEMRATITPIYGKRLYMNMYPWKWVRGKFGRKQIRLLSPIYNKLMRTGFMSRDKSRMYLRWEGSAGHGRKGIYVTSVKGRNVPRLFEELGMKKVFQPDLIKRIKEAIKKAIRSSK